MRKSLILVLFTCACIKLQAQVNIITTIAGIDSAGYSGNGGPATDAKLNVPTALCLDNLNNLYISDAFNHAIRKINTVNEIITTIAGTDTAGFSGDGGPATYAKLFIPECIFTDTSGNVYIADGGNNRIRKVTVSTGIISTIAGSGPTGVGAGGDSGDGGLAIDAQMNGPVGLCIDRFGNIFIGDYNNNRVRKIDAITGIITSFAGTGAIGYLGDGGAATDAKIDGPSQIFADTSGNILICDQWNHAIRKVDATSNVITTIAGNGSAGHTGDGGLAKYATLNQPAGIYLDKQENIFIAEYGDGVIRKIDGATGIISTVAGTGTLGFFGDGEPATAAELRCSDVFLDNNGIMYIADEDNNRVRIVYNDKLGVVSPPPSPGERVVWPNPVGDELHIDNAMGCDVRVFNLLGQELLSSKLKSDGETVNISKLIPGMYIVRIMGVNGGVESFRVVKEW